MCEIVFVGLIEAWKGISKPVVGMLHLQALPGSPRRGVDLESVRTALWRDAEALVEVGVNGLMLVSRLGSHVAFERRCISPRCVAPRLNTLGISPSSRLAIRAPRRSRC